MVLNIDCIEELTYAEETYGKEKQSSITNESKHDMRDKNFMKGSEDMKAPSYSEVIRDEAHNNAIKEAIIRLYKLEAKNIDVQEAIKLLEGLLRK